MTEASSHTLDVITNAIRIDVMMDINEISGVSCPPPINRPSLPGPISE
ncbi:MAG: hypothetical protein ACJ795_23355 [Ktedonobacteraceae bacterium]